MTIKHIYWLSMLSALLMVACSPSKPTDATEVTALPPIFPDYIGVTIPAEIAPMNFNVDGADAVYVGVTGSKGGELEASGDYADFDIDDWHELTRRNVGGKLTFDVYARQDGKWLHYKPFDMMVSEHPLTDYGVTYRKIAPGFETFSKVGIYQRELSTFDETPILEETAAKGQCMNCHYANRANPAQYSLHIRGKHGGTLLHTDGKLQYVDTKTDRTPGACTYGYWHPDGRYCAYSVNRIYQNFYVGPDNYVEPWDYFSDIVVFDTRDGKLITDTLLMTEDFQTTPAFSADGRQIYFSYAPKANMPADYQQLRYSLCRVDFDAERGQIGSSIDTIIDARAIGKSVSIARPSYDGRWLMYCLTDYGTTPVDHRDADLWIMDLATGEQRCMYEVNSPNADAYHNWSSDSRWFVFGSRRLDDLYANLYFATIDDTGHATKPFLLPQRNPRKYYDEALHSFNTPDFTTVPVPLDPVEARHLVDAGAKPIK